MEFSYLRQANKFFHFLPKNPRRFPKWKSYKYPFPSRTENPVFCCSDHSNGIKKMFTLVFHLTLCRCLFFSGFWHLFLASHNFCSGTKKLNAFLTKDTCEFFYIACKDQLMSYRIPLREGRPAELGW